MRELAWRLYTFHSDRFWYYRSQFHTPGKHATSKKWADFHNKWMKYWATWL